MNQLQLFRTAELLAERSGLAYDQRAVEKLDLAGSTAHYSEVRNFCNDLSKIMGVNDLLVLRNETSEESLLNYCKELENPMLVFAMLEGGLTPVLLHQQKNKLEAIAVRSGGEEEVPISALTELTRFEKGDVLFLMVFKNQSPGAVEDASDNHEHLTPYQRLVRLLTVEKKEIAYIFIYAIVIGLIGLTLPLGTQAIISLISSGVLFTTVIFLIAFVLIGVLLTGGLQIMQHYMVEILQRRIFAKAAYDFALRVPRFKLEAIRGDHAPELMNRFFDVLTIQKSLPKLLIDMSGALLQIFFGLILLSFYHQFFVFFGIFLFLFIGWFVLQTGKNGMKWAIKTSKDKYRVVYWLEELARSLTAFKMSGTTYYPVKRTDIAVESYLTHRAKHFRVLMGQYGFIVLFKMLVVGGVLVIGSLLVIDRQISLGQFVASEIIIVLVINSVEKIIAYLDAVYDILVAVDKIGHVMDIPLERQGGVKVERQPKNNIGMRLEMLEVSYAYEKTSRFGIKDFTLDIEAGERVAITGYSNSGKNTLMSLIAGVYDNFQGAMVYNGLNSRDVDLVSFHDHISMNLSETEIFEGSIYDNISVGKSNVDYHDLMDAVKTVRLDREINMMEAGLNTPLVAGGQGLSTSTALKILIARCIVKAPQLLLLNDNLSALSNDDQKHILAYLTAKERPWTLIILSDKPKVHALCERILILKEGKLILDGPTASVSQTEIYKDIVTL
ncbi:peptidase domain-containing ABC transporter [Persicobacter psychrovividus]|uniref:ABC transporter ATP-binding protein n=1 Tax=Persicobacter psychrovividus TaxID=387638 RepID=A0ABN6LGV0_9BACT|nr:ABC transporter ATP-binding protein [Persicobacter psychrovividus]